MDDENYIFIFTESRLVLVHFDLSLVLYENRLLPLGKPLIIHGIVLEVSGGTMPPQLYGIGNIKIEKVHFPVALKRGGISTPITKIFLMYCFQVCRSNFLYTLYIRVV